MPQPKILIADDEPTVLEFIRQALSSQPWVVELAKDGREALDLLSSQHFDVAVLDLEMPHLNGMQVLEEVQGRGIETDLLILTGYGTVEVAVSAIKKGVKDFLTKPFKADELIGSIKNLIAKRHSSTHPLANKLEAFVRDHYSEPGLKLGDICAHFGISTRYASRLFRNEVGMKFRRRLAFYRVKRAKHLIRCSDEPFYVIAEKCGFRNYRQLTSTFQRLEGITPRGFRRDFILKDKVSHELSIR